MTTVELLAKWTAQAEEMRRRASLVSGAALCEEFVADLRSLAEGEEAVTLNLQQAARESGYSADHLGRLVRAGQIPNAGRPNAPRIRRRDLPRKAGALPPASPEITLVGATPRQIARAVVTSTRREAR
jgi:hypothetical protein